MDMATTGKTIAKLRIDAGLTQASLAEKLDISDKAVSKWEREYRAQMFCCGINYPYFWIQILRGLFMDTPSVKNG